VPLGLKTKTVSGAFHNLNRPFGAPSVLSLRLESLDRLAHRAHHLGTLRSANDNETPGLPVVPRRSLACRRGYLPDYVFGNIVLLERANASPSCNRFEHIRQ
jgi:hypothetical protein